VFDKFQNRSNLKLYFGPFYAFVVRVLSGFILVGDRALTFPVCHVLVLILIKDTKVNQSRAENYFIFVFCCLININDRQRQKYLAAVTLRPDTNEPGFDTLMFSQLFAVKELQKVILIKD